MFSIIFQVSGLNSGRGLKITVFAANSNGRSPNVVLEGFTLKVAELQVGEFFLQVEVVLIMCFGKVQIDQIESNFYCIVSTIG